jgi:hypothetical protein
MECNLDQSHLAELAWFNRNQQEPKFNFDKPFTVSTLDPNITHFKQVSGGDFP